MDRLQTLSMTLLDTLSSYVSISISRAKTHSPCLLSFFLNVTATTEIYTLSLHDALPIWRIEAGQSARADDHVLDHLVHRVVDMDVAIGVGWAVVQDKFRTTFADLPQLPVQVNAVPALDRKSTRLNSSHVRISYAVFCLKK